MPPATPGLREALGDDMAAHRDPVPTGRGRGRRGRRNPTTVRRRAVAAAGAVLLTVVACGGPDPDLATPETTPGTTAAPTPVVAPTSPGPTTPVESPTTPEVGPLDLFLEDLADAWDEDWARAQMARAEEITAACMLEHGFTYVPIDYSGGGGTPPPVEEPDVVWGTLEFAETYGYGATTDPWSDSGPVMEDPVEPWVDPNDGYVDGLSETERQAYNLALYGEEHHGAGAAEYRWEDAGCSGRAQHEVYDTPGGLTEDELIELQEGMGALGSAVAADPRVVAAAARWADCMADAGHPGLTAVTDAEEAVYEAVNEVYERAYADVERDAPMTEEQWQALEAETGPQLAALTAWEIETAVDDLRCRAEVGYDEIEHQVDVEHQEEFVAEHRAELDAWLEATRKLGGPLMGD